jgi:hypothetical protein
MDKSVLRAGNRALPRQDCLNGILGILAIDGIDLEDVEQTQLSSGLPVAPVHRPDLPLPAPWPPEAIRPG